MEGGKPCVPQINHLLFARTNETKTRGTNISKLKTAIGVLTQLVPDNDMVTPKLSSHPQHLDTDTVEIVQARLGTYMVMLGIR